MLFSSEKKKFFKKSTLFVLFSILFLLFSFNYTFALADQQILSGEVLGPSLYDLNLSLGEKRTLLIKFKNTSNVVWSNDGINFVSLITADPLRRRSYAQDSSWENFFRPARILENRVEPGEIATIKFILHAPIIPGVSKENFVLTFGTRIIKGTKIKINFEVKKQKDQIVNVSKVDENILFDKKTDKQIKDLDYPIRDTSYQALFLIGNKNIEMSTGDIVKVRLGFKNTGVSKWYKDGKKFVSLYTVRPNYHNSLFATDTWLNKNQIKMNNKEVKPGEVAYFFFDIKAPDRPGEYVENLRLAVEDYSWIAAGEVELKIVVKEKSNILNNKVSDNSDIKNNFSGDVEIRPEEVLENNQNNDLINEQAKINPHAKYQAFKIIQSSSKLMLKPGEFATYTVGFKNTGTEVWKNKGKRFISLYTWGPKYRLSAFFAASKNTNWINPSQIRMETEEVKPGEIGFFRFVVQAPPKTGTFTEKFMLAAEDTTWIPGGELVLTIVVSTDLQASDSLAVNDVESSDKEPIIRVGLFHTNKELVITASGPFNIKDAQGNLVASMRAGSKTVVNFDFTQKKYLLQAGVLKKTFDQFLRFIPINNSVIMEVANYQRRAPWKQSINFNKWRGILEVRYSNKTGRLWVINELPMEDYLKGIAETSASSPLEFLKVMSIVARTYAMYHYQRRSKHADEHFYVDSDYDQVYRGYTAELLLGRLTQAVDETRGMVVKYNGKIAITPYFSQSDGRTRDWSEVWGGGSVAWLKSVPVPYDKGKRLKGHGVGLSARGALLMILNDNKKYDEVLKYFYKGVEIVKDYK